MLFIVDKQTEMNICLGKWKTKKPRKVNAHEIGIGVGTGRGITGYRIVCVLCVCYGIRNRIT